MEIRIKKRERLYKSNIEYEVNRAITSAKFQ